MSLLWLISRPTRNVASMKGYTGWMSLAWTVDAMSTDGRCHQLKEKHSGSICIYNVLHIWQLFDATFARAVNNSNEYWRPCNNCDILLDETTIAINHVVVIRLILLPATPGRLPCVSHVHIRPHTRLYRLHVLHNHWQMYQNSSVHQFVLLYTCLLCCWCIWFDTCYCYVSICSARLMPVHIPQQPTLLKQRHN